MKALATINRFPNREDLRDWNYSRDLHACIDHLSEVFYKPRIACYIDPLDDEDRIWIEGICYPREWFNVTRIRREPDDTSRERSALNGLPWAADYRTQAAGEYNDEVHILRREGGAVVKIFTGCDRYALAYAWITTH